MIRIVSLLSLLALFVSCDKQGTNNGDFRIKLVEDGSLKIQYSYDSDGRISTISRDYNGNVIDWNYTYDDTVMVVSSNVFSTQYWFLNENGQPFNIIIDVDEGVFLSYNNDHHVDTLRYYTNFGGVIDYTYTYSYTNGRLDTVRFFDNQLIMYGVLAIEYDIAGRPLKFGDEEIYHQFGQVVEILRQDSSGYSRMSFLYEPDNRNFYKRVNEHNTIYSQGESEVFYTYEKGKGIFPFDWKHPGFESKGLPNFMNYAY